MDQMHTFFKDLVCTSYLADISKMLVEMPNSKYFLAIMDDCMIHSKRKDHLNYLIALLKALIGNRLKYLQKDVNYLDKN